MQTTTRKYVFEMGQGVAIDLSGESGEVIGRAEHAHAENSYLVRYVLADGRATEAWWGESALRPGY